MSGGAVVAQGAAAVAGQAGQFAGLQLQCRADLYPERGELGSVVGTDDAGVGCPARPRMADEVSDAPVGAEAVAAHLLDLGVQVGEPWAPSGGEQRVAA
jgi:hypothetical protein